MEHTKIIVRVSDRAVEIYNYIRPLYQMWSIFTQMLSLGDQRKVLKSVFQCGHTVRRDFFLDKHTRVCFLPLLTNMRWSLFCNLGGQLNFLLLSAMTLL